LPVWLLIRSPSALFRLFSLRLPLCLQVTLPAADASAGPRQPRLVPWAFL